MHECVLGSKDRPVAHTYSSKLPREDLGACRPGPDVSDGYKTGARNWPGVVRAAKEFAKEDHLKLIVHDSKWAVVKPL